jgi:hypothetical protein
MLAGVPAVENSRLRSVRRRIRPPEVRPVRAGKNRPQRRGVSKEEEDAGKRPACQLNPESPFQGPFPESSRRYGRSSTLSRCPRSATGG